MIWCIKTYIIAYGLMQNRCNFSASVVELSLSHQAIPDSKVYGAHMGPTWVLLAPDGSHVGPMNLAIWDDIVRCDLWIKILDLLLCCCACLYDMPWSPLDLGRNVTGNCNFDIWDGYACLWCWGIVADEYHIHENYVFTEGRWSLIKLHLNFVGVNKIMPNIFWIWLVTLATWNNINNTMVAYIDIMYLIFCIFRNNIEQLV